MASVLITDASHPAAEAIASALREAGVTVYLASGFPDEESIRKSVTRTGPVDGLVLSDHNGLRALLGQGDGREIARVGNRNLISAYGAARHYGALMAERGRGAMVFLSSNHADKPTGINAAYSVSQGALRMMMKELALFFGNQGVRVNAVLLGPMEEEREMFDSQIIPVDYDAETKIPLHRRATGADAASAVRFLLSEEAAFVNGAELSVDGGGLYHYFDRPYTCRKEAELP